LLRNPGLIREPFDEEAHSIRSVGLSGSIRQRLDDTHRLLEGPAVAKDVEDSRRGQGAVEGALLASAE